MKTFRIMNGFDRMTVAELLLKANLIKTSMTGNPHFETPSPTLVSVGLLITALQSAAEAAASGDKQLIAVRNQIRESLVAQLHLLGNYVLFTAAGDEVVASSSGFSVSKTVLPRPPIDVPQGLVVKNGKNRGEIEFRCKRVFGATSYLHEMAPAPLTPQSQWQSIYSTTTKNLYTGLQSGQEYIFRIAAVGPKQQMVYSPEVSRMAP